MYETVKNYRTNCDSNIDSLMRIFKEVKSNYPSEWLLLLELYELVYDKDLSLKNEIYEELLKLKQNKQFTKLISDGLDLIIKK
jgi:phenylalanine-4-hydroxylase